MPAADVDVSTDLVRQLLAGQHPDLAQLPVEFMANGWDNAIFRVGNTLLARLPRREPAAAILLNEQRWLPVLAPQLQLPVPCPERTGLPAHGYPWSWSVVPYLPGGPATTADGLDLASVAATMGGFLGSLHAPAPPDAPANPYRGVPLADRAGQFEETSASCPAASTPAPSGAPGQARSRPRSTPGRRSGCTVTCTPATS